MCNKSSIVTTFPERRIAIGRWDPQSTLTTTIAPTWPAVADSDPMLIFITEINLNERLIRMSAYGV